MLAAATHPQYIATHRCRDRVAGTAPTRSQDSAELIDVDHHGHRHESGDRRQCTHLAVDTGSAGA